jgi:hypothetical protein
LRLKTEVEREKMGEGVMGRGGETEVSSFAIASADREVDIENYTPIFVTKPF